MLCVATKKRQKRGSGSLLTIKKTAATVILELDLVQGDIRMIITLAETKQHTPQTMEVGTSKPWDISWCSNSHCLPTLYAKTSLTVSHAQISVHLKNSFKIGLKSAYKKPL